MSKLREAAQAALEAIQELEYRSENITALARVKADSAKRKLRAALAELDHTEPDLDMVDDARLRIERLVKSNARRAMVIDTIERLLEDPTRTDFDSATMEYWGPLHDRLKAALIPPTGKSALQVAEQDTDRASTEIDGRWCWWLDSDEPFHVVDSEGEAHGEARSRIDDEFPPGVRAEYCVARVVSPLEKIAHGTMGRWLGDHIHEQIDEWCAEESGAEDEVLSLTDADRDALSKLVIDWMCKHAAVQWWTYDSLTQTTNIYIAGSDHD